jgi:SAM-dependent methyltransferase
MSTVDFYDRLAPFHHLIFADWEASIERQAGALDAIIRSRLGRDTCTVLDVACGIGTQSLGLARLGYVVTASDLSPAAVMRCAREAQSRGLSLSTSIADMRRVFEHYNRTFDAVIACDNSVPHLLTDGEILTAFSEFFKCTAPGGLCLISVRDYAVMDRSLQLYPHGVRRVGETSYVLFQVWEWTNDCYTTTMYVVEHRQGREPTVHTMCSGYYAVTIPTLIALLQRAGFADVERLDHAFFQPLLIGHKPAAS